MNGCSYLGCSTIARVRGLCSLHYKRWHNRGRNGAPLTNRGRMPKLTYPQLRLIDNWHARTVRKPMLKQIAWEMGCHPNTVMAAAQRRGAYAECPRG